MINKLLSFITGHRKTALYFSGIFLLFIGLLDYFLPYELKMSVFYVLPVFLVTYVFGKKHGVLVSFVAASLWFIIDIITMANSGHFMAVLWNAAMMLCIFIIIALLLSRLIRLLNYEKEHSRIDYLTQTPNLRYFSEYCATELERADRYRHPVSLAYIDLDDFKHINDARGHSEGDKVLTAVAAVFKKSIRRMDFVARVGGDEFVILFPETPPAPLKEAVKRMQNELAAAMKKNSWFVSISIGAVTFEYAPANMNELIRAADSLMYEAKKMGKNRAEFKVYEKK